jgi:hypothetical protein
MIIAGTIVGVGAGAIVYTAFGNEGISGFKVRHRNIIISRYNIVFL